MDVLTGVIVGEEYAALSDGVGQQIEGCGDGDDRPHTRGGVSQRRSQFPDCSSAEMSIRPVSGALRVGPGAVCVAQGLPDRGDRRGNSGELPHMRVEQKGLLALGDPLVAAGLRREFAVNLRNLKALIETRAE